MGGSFRRRRPVGKLRGGWKNAFRRDSVDLLQIRMWRAAVRNIGDWWREIGKTLARKRDEKEEAIYMSAASYFGTSQVRFSSWNLSILNAASQEFLPCL
jgi:hypothetical protein